MKIMRHPFTYLLGGVLALSGCEGGGITGTGLDILKDPIPVSVGVITNFGSVYVNGVKFDSSNTKFKLDDLEGIESDLKVGMIVSVAGKIESTNTGTATQITFNDDVEGRVIANNISSGNTLDIMGQTIHVDADTNFESLIPDTVATLEEIEVGNIVEVSGYNSGDGNIYATRIEVKKKEYVAGEEIQVTGLTKSTTETSFQIGSLTVLYSNAEYDSIPNDVIVDGLFVEVKSKQGFSIGGALIADKVELEGDGKKKFGVENGQELELEGIVSNFNSDNQTFVLNGQIVRFGSDSALALIGNGLKIKVHGTINTDGELVVSEFEAKRESNVQVAAYVESIDIANNTLVLLGQTILLSDATSMNDEQDSQSDAAAREFTIDEINEGDFLEINAFRDADSQDEIIVWQAIKLERDDPEDDGQVALQGVITATPTDNTLVVAGVTVDISIYQDAGVGLDVGTQVEIEGRYTQEGILVAEAK